VIAGPALVTQSNMAGLLGPILFVVVVIGGLGSLAGALVGSLVIGLLQTFAAGFDTSIAELARAIGIDAAPTGGILHDLWNVTVAQVSPILPYLLLVVVMIVRPTGLMGTRET
ncbi:MAG: branched-chain amino acid ABC transporter permease, partial [Acetobacteraceae bacterium]|nr:branched-chain amino acid ABC transporter permease [Acetobacteraceae bacterium]